MRKSRDRVHSIVVKDMVITSKRLAMRHKKTLSINDMKGRNGERGLLLPACSAASPATKCESSLLKTDETLEKNNRDMQATAFHISWGKQASLITIDFDRALLVPITCMCY